MRLHPLHLHLLALGPPFGPGWPFPEMPGLVLPAVPLPEGPEHSLGLCLAVVQLLPLDRTLVLSSVLKFGFREPLTAISHLLTSMIRIHCNDFESKLSEFVH